MSDRETGYVDYEGYLINRQAIGDTPYQDAAILMESILTEGRIGGDGKAFERLNFNVAENEVNIILASSEFSSEAHDPSEIDSLEPSDAEEDSESPLPITPETDWFTAPRKPAGQSPRHHRRPWWQDTRKTSPGACHEPGTRNRPEYDDSDESGFESELGYAPSNHREEPPYDDQLPDYDHDNRLPPEML